MMLFHRLAKENKLHVIANGINVKSFSQTCNGSPLIDSYGSGIIKLLMVSGFREQKDHKTLIDSLTLMEQNVHLFLVGDGVTSNYYQQYVIEQKLFSRVHFLGVRSNIAELIYSSDILIISSHWEGFGLIAVEAMAIGKPVVGSDVEGLREVISGAGILFKANNILDLATTLNGLIYNQELYQKTAAQCKKRSWQYDVAETAKSYQQLYERCYSDL